MNTVAARSSLAKLRAKTDRQLADLVRRELDHGSAFANVARYEDAKRSYEIAEALLAISQLPGPDRVKLQQELDQLRDALPQRAMSAA